MQQLPGTIAVDWVVTGFNAAGIGNPHSGASGIIEEIRYTALPNDSASVHDGDGVAHIPYQLKIVQNV
jgi:hypothetical protein